MRVRAAFLKTRHRPGYALAPRQVSFRTPSLGNKALPPPPGYARGSGRCVDALDVVLGLPRRAKPRRTPAMECGAPVGEPPENSGRTFSADHQPRSSLAVSAAGVTRLVASLFTRPVADSEPRQREPRKPARHLVMSGRAIALPQFHATWTPTYTGAEGEQGPNTSRKPENLPCMGRRLKEQWQWYATAEAT
ncbi:hypothetical protein HPB52_009897 [Rhipicephalus sanguineus]|uniref:Uncharacterized protein n=1 Tax=Rhipicephalus sanguineus TaxID=34632 RepID=A0A9D4Q9J4_RHISA|nr:hypothetical protein HPB52_009897 [Rhipicephalus sanguineus]